MILKAESYCLITVHGLAYNCEGDISAKNFSDIANDVLDNFNGQDETLEKFKNMVNNAEY
jgi:hypothetical protein